MRSLGVILALSLAGLQMFAVSTIVFLSYFTSERALLEHARNQLEDVGTNVIQHTKSFLSPAKNAAELSTALAENQIVRREERDLLEGLLFQQLQTAPQFAGAYYGDEHGNFVYVRRSITDNYETKIVNIAATPRTTLIERSEDFFLLSAKPDPNDTFDPRDRPWYQAAKEGMHSIWTDPYIFFTSQSPGITAATPVIGFDGTVQGVIGVDIEIKEISEFLAQLRIGKRGAAFVLNQNGDVIAHPDTTLLTTPGDGGVLQFPSIGQVGDPVARAAFAGRITKNGISIDREVHTNFEHQGIRYVSLIMPFGLGEVPWTIVVYAPEDDFIGTIKANRWSNTLIAIVVVLVTMVLGLALANKIYAPVRAFAVRSALVSQGEIDPTAPMPTTYRELENANTTLVHEISQRKKTEAEYRLTFDMASRGMVYLSSKSGNLLRSNARFAEMLGYKQSELAELQFQKLLHPDEADMLVEFENSISRRSPFGFESRAIRKNGESIWLSFNGVFIQSGEKDPGYIVATIDDITQARKSEEMIQALNLEIARVSRQQLVGNLATGLAHELNQPLTAITQNIDAAKSMIGDTATPKSAISELLVEIDRQAHQAGDIVHALRGFIQKEDDRTTVFGIYELFEHSRRLVLSEARQRSVEVVVSKEPETMVRAVRVQIAQVMVNLLRNAIEAMEETDRNKRTVYVSAGVQGDELQVDVRDTGPGAAREISLFTKFETTKSNGMGLGLSISQSLIKTNGGRIWYEQTTTGAKFSFTLPLEGSQN